MSRMSERLLCKARLSFERQILVDEGDGHAAFANAAYDALDRAVADVAGAENAREVSFECEGVATG